MYMRRNLKAARKAKKMTQLEVADAVHIERSYYTKIERGNRTPSLELALRIREVLGYKDDDMFLNYL